MNISGRKIKTLYIKDFKDLFKNSSVLIGCLIPVLFILLYKNMTFGNMHMPEEFLIKLGMVFNLGMVPLMIISTTVAEEKEKNTMRTLMLSNVSGLEFFISKMLVPVTFLVVSDALIYLIVGMDMKYFPGFMIFNFLGSVSMVMIGGVIGIMARDQMSAGVYQVPAMLILFLPSVLSAVNETIEKIAKCTPTEAVSNLFFSQVDKSFASAGLFFSIAVLLLWSAAATAVFALMYRKKGVDN